VSVKLALRIAAFVMLFHAIGHTMGIATWKNPSSKVPPVVIQAMVDNNFLFQGAPGNMARFYEGMGYSATIAILLVVSILWIASNVDAKNVRLAANFLLPVAGFLFLLALDEWIYFFPMAMAFSAVAMLLTLWAISRMRKA